MQARHVDQLYQLLEKTMSLFEKDLDTLEQDDVKHGAMIKKNITDSLDKITSILIEINKNHVVNEECPLENLTNNNILKEYYERILVNI